MRIGGALAAVLALGIACGGNPEPGEPGYAYNLDGEYNAEFAADDGVAYSGVMALETAPGGAVSGTMSLSNPVVVNGTVEGLIVGAELSISVPYEIPDNGCTGVASGTAIIEEGGGAVNGSVDIADECGGAPLSAAFTLWR